jgi:hypothetical protein
MCVLLSFFISFFSVYFCISLLIFLHCLFLYRSKFLYIWVSISKTVSQYPCLLECFLLFFSFCFIFYSFYFFIFVFPYFYSIFCVSQFFILISINFSCFFSLSFIHVFFSSLVLNLFLLKIQFVL